MELNYSIVLCMAFPSASKRTYFISSELKSNQCYFSEEKKQEKTVIKQEFSLFQVVETKVRLYLSFCARFFTVY